MGYIREYKGFKEMLGLLLKSFYYNLSKWFGFSPKLMPLNITVSLTFHCNSRCRTCNVWTRNVDEFTLEEFDKTFKSMGKTPYWFTLSGGEPFLRKDILDICKSLYKRCAPKVINIPTNGILYDVIPEKVKQICEALPGTGVVINLSLDGVGEKHDQIRGVPGNYEKWIKTYKALRELNLPNLTIGIMTVISSYNVKDIPQILEEVKKLDPDSYVAEIAEEREELLNKEQGITPAYEDYVKAVECLNENLHRHRFRKFSSVIQSFRLVYYELTKHIMRQKRQVLPCMAGWASAHIVPDGEVWFCCIRGENIGNLRKENYNFKKIWNSTEAEIQRKSIKNKECWCPLANVSYTNILCDYSMLAGVFFTYAGFKLKEIFKR
ncbi:MAG: radical SAM protein [Armatimonadota bacterium]